LNCDATIMGSLYLLAVIAPHNRVFVTGINFAIAFLFSLPAKIRSTEYRVDVIPSAEFVSSISAKRVPGTVGLNANTNKALAVRSWRIIAACNTDIKNAQFSFQLSKTQNLFLRMHSFVPDSNDRNVDRKSQR
jgi:hypothetical protein